VFFLFSAGVVGSWRNRKIVTRVSKTMHKVVSSFHLGSLSSMLADNGSQAIGNTSRNFPEDGGSGLYVPLKGSSNVTNTTESTHQQQQLSVVNGTRGAVVILGASTTTVKGLSEILYDGPNTTLSDLLRTQGRVVYASGTLGATTGSLDKRMEGPVEVVPFARSSWRAAQGMQMPYLFLWKGGLVCGEGKEGDAWKLPAGGGYRVRIRAARGGSVVGTEGGGGGGGENLNEDDWDVVLSAPFELVY
jgi:hypothetical protein